MNLRWTLASKVFLQLYEDFESNFDLTRLEEQKVSLLEEVEVMLRSHENHQQLVRSSQVQYYFDSWLRYSIIRANDHPTMKFLKVPVKRLAINRVVNKNLNLGSSVNCTTFSIRVLTLFNRLQL